MLGLVVKESTCSNADLPVLGKFTLFVQPNGVVTIKNPAGICSEIGFPPSNNTFGVKNISANTLGLATDSHIIGDATGSEITYTLPNHADAYDPVLKKGIRISIKNEKDTSNFVLVVGDAFVDGVDTSVSPLQIPFPNAPELIAHANGWAII